MLILVFSIQFLHIGSIKYFDVVSKRRLLYVTVHSFAILHHIQ